MVGRNVRVIMTQWIFAHGCVDIGARFMTCCTNSLPKVDLCINENLFIPKNVFSPPEFLRRGNFIVLWQEERGTEGLKRGEKNMMSSERKKAKYENLSVVKEAVFIAKQQKISRPSVVDCQTNR